MYSGVARHQVNGHESRVRDRHPKLSADLKLMNVFLAQVNIVLPVVFLDVGVHERVTVNEPIVKASNQKRQLETGSTVDDRISDQGTLSHKHFYNNLL